MAKKNAIRVTAKWYISCDADCPHCYKTVDLFRDDRLAGLGIKPGDPSPINSEIVCKKCGETFVVNHVNK